MLLGAKLIKNYINNNIWDYTDVIRIRKNEVSVIYFQLVDLDRDNQRYVSPYSSTDLSMTAYFGAIDDTLKVTLSATIANVDDKSIWTISIPSTVVIHSGAMKITFIENSVTKSFIINQAISVDTLKIGSC